MTKSSDSSSFQWLMHLVSTQRRRLVTSMLLALGYSLLALVPYILIYQLISIFLYENNVDYSKIWRLVFFAALALGAKISLQLTSGLLSHKAAFQLLFDLRRQMVDRIGLLPLSACHKQTTAQLKKIISDDIGRIETFVAHHLPDMSAAIITPFAATILLFFFDWRLALVALLPLPIAISMLMWMFSGFSKKNDAYYKVTANLHTSVIDFVKNIPLVKAFSMTVDSHKRYHKAVSDHHQLVTEWLKDTRTPTALFKLSLDLGLLLLMPVSILLYANGSVTVATIFMFLLLGIGLLEPFYNLLQFSNLLTQLLKGVDNIRAFMTIEPQKEGANPVDINHYDISFDKVSFTHANAKDATIAELSFTAKQGEITALIGPSGAGKSTAVQLIARFYEHQQGAIRIGGVPIEQFPLSQLTDIISFVFQDTFIFDDTVMNNIRMGNNKVSNEAVIAAAKAARADEFIQQLPKQYDTELSTNSLSGGQAQRIAIARAILKDSPIVLLDEATAFADARNEAYIQMALSELIKNKTVVIIAHRLNTLVNIPHIILLDKGRKVAEGNHDNLLINSSLYQKMWHAHQSVKKWHLNQAEEVTL